LPLHGIANSALADGFAAVYRDEDYLEYKLYSKTKVIGIGKVKIWISNKHGIMIGDINGLTNANFIATIKTLKWMAKLAGIRQIQFHCSEGAALQQLFSLHYPALPSYPVLFQDFGAAIAPEKIKFNFADIDIF
jgi:hypothetical protein